MAKGGVSLAFGRDGKLQNLELYHAEDSIRMESQLCFKILKQSCD